MTLPLRVALDQCQRHARLICGALADLPDTFDAHAVAGDNGPLIRTIDQFVLRFIKLQDTLGEHVLSAFASEVLAEPVSDLPLIDVLARLERYGFVDAAQWARWRARPCPSPQRCPIKTTLNQQIPLRCACRTPQPPPHRRIEAVPDRRSNAPRQRLFSVPADPECC